MTIKEEKAGEGQSAENSAALENTVKTKTQNEKARTPLKNLAIAFVLAIFLLAVGYAILRFLNAA